MRVRISPGSAVLAAVVEEEVFERNRPARIAVAQLDGCAERDQHRRRIPDRRAVGDVAADGAGGAHLLRAEAAQHLAHVRIDPPERGLGLGVGGGGADLDPVVRLPHLVERGDPSGVHDARQVPELLGDPQAHVGRPADDGGVGVTGAELRERILGGGRGEERPGVADEEVGVTGATGVGGGLGPVGEPGRAIRPSRPRASANASSASPVQQASAASAMGR